MDPSEAELNAIDTIQQAHDYAGTAQDVRDELGQALGSSNQAPGRGLYHATGVGQSDRHVEGQRSSRCDHWGGT